jgi:hypothetical protein
MSFREARTSFRFWCTVFAFSLFGTLTLAAPAFAQLVANNCVQDEFTIAGNSQTLGCTANDVRVAYAVNVRDPSTGKTLSSCKQGTHFNFLADFEIVTSSTSSRSNIGRDFATENQPNALTGSCVDNIISPQHQCPGGATGIMCGSDNYHELDPQPPTKGAQADNCGDTSATDVSPTFGVASEGVTIEVDNFLCEPPVGSTSNQLVLPNCTSWQVPGKTLTCDSPATSYPYEIAAIPGSPSKCNCSSIPLPITVVQATDDVQKACNTANTSQTPTFTQNPDAQSPTSCDAGTEGSTVTYTVAITNPSTDGGILVDQICDSQYGNVFTVSGFKGVACSAGSIGTATNVSCPPSQISKGTTGTCTFTAVQGENATVTDIVNISAHSALNPSSLAAASSNSVTVTSSDAPSTATVTKGMDSTTAGCATVRYSVDVANTSGYDEALSLSAFDDSAYGSITTVHGSVLGTTCGVADGLGTLAGTGNGAGTLPATLVVGGSDYKCKFDAQFCGALGSITLPNGSTCIGIQHTNKVTGTIIGDEGAGDTVSQTGNTFTVDECFTTVTSSTTP